MRPLGGRDILWALARDVRITPVRELASDELRRQLLEDEPESADFFAVHRPRSRSNPIAVAPEARRFLNRFRRPTTFIDAVARTALAERLEPSEALKELKSLTRRLVSSGLLVRSGGSKRKRLLEIKPGFEPGTSFLGWAVDRPIRVMIDSEVYFLSSKEIARAVLKIARTPQASKSLRREVAVLRALEGIDTGALLGSGRWRGRDYCILASAGDKHAQDAATGPRRERALLAARCLSALAGVHERGYLHGDVHPGNFMVDESGTVRVIDFGYAQKLRADGTGEGGPRGGVLPYYAPEHAAKSRARTTAGEVYAGAAMAYFLIAGEPYLPVKALREEALEQIMHAPPRPFPSPWPEVEAVLAKALSKDPGGRHGSMREFADALARAAASDCGGAAAPLRAFSTSFLDELKGLTYPRWKSGADGPWAGLNFGGAGVAYALWQSAVELDDADLLAQADAWIAHARNDAEAEFAFRGSSGDWSFAREDSIFYGRPGLPFVQALVSHSMDAQTSREDALAALEEKAPEDDAPCELLQGLAGHVVAATILLAHTRHETARRLAAKRAGALLERAGDPDRPWDDMPNYGFAHGWGGVYFSLLQWSAVSGESLPDWLGAGLKRFAGQGRWPVKRSGGRLINSWCNGAPGLTLLWAKAFELTGEGLYMDAARACAAASRADRDAFSNLCCGAAGRAAALSAMARIEPGRGWENDALELAHLSLEKRRQTEWPMSLLKGQAGLLPTALALNRGRLPRFSAVEVL